LNKAGAAFGKLPYVSAMTDVTGFGLLGHLCEVCEGSNLTAEIDFDQIPKFDFLEEYLQQRSVPGGTLRNWDSYGSKVSILSETQRSVLADPQTSGGLLVCVDPHYAADFERVAQQLGLSLQSFGKLIKQQDKTINIR
ncbi:MAG: AIR synthase-related protein, partial [Flammeovirgaceae bacterium]